MRLGLFIYLEPFVTDGQTRLGFHQLDYQEVSHGSLCS